jgi:hypothetical protein
VDLQVDYIGAAETELLLLDNNPAKATVANGKEKSQRNVSHVGAGFDMGKSREC